MLPVRQRRGPPQRLAGPQQRGDHLRPATTSNLSREGQTPPRYARARDDAAAFVASDGHIRGPELERALRELRQQPLPAGTDDLALARTILASTP